LLTQSLSKMLGYQAPTGVRHSARREWHDQANRLVGPGVLSLSYAKTPSQQDSESHGGDGKQYPAPWRTSGGISVHFVLFQVVG
jgi:hypothetical protein